VSYAIDVNVFLYASDRSSVHSARALEFLAECAAGPEVVCVAWPTVMSYLRLATHPSIFAHPLSPDEAIGNVDSLLRLPHVRALGEEEGFWTVFRDVAGSTPTRGNLVPDAHLAALLRQHGVTTLYTNDKDFRKFDFLKVRNPFDSAPGR
jgi:toxin-antitoxin system PIN domain toxin